MVTELSSPDEGISIDMSEDTLPAVTDSCLADCTGRATTPPMECSARRVAESVFIGPDNSPHHDGNSPSHTDDNSCDDRSCTSADREMCSQTTTTHHHATNCKQDHINERYFWIFEVLVLSAALLVVITLFSIPTILFELPENEV